MDFFVYFLAIFWLSLNDYVFERGKVEIL